MLLLNGSAFNRNLERGVPVQLGIEREVNREIQATIVVSRKHPSPDVSPGCSEEVYRGLPTVL